MINKKKLFLLRPDGSKEIYPPIPSLCQCKKFCGTIVYGYHKYAKGHHLYGDSNPMKNPEIAKKVSDAQLGSKNHSYGKEPWNKNTIGIMKSNSGSFKKGESSHWKGEHLSEDHRSKISKALKGKYLQEENHRWNGGAKLSSARGNHKRRLMGFIPLTIKNHYNEPIEYHHIDPNRPYVVPCPTRIHKMFRGRDKKEHARKVNIFLGIIRLEEYPDKEVVEMFTKYKLKRYKKSKNESLFDF